MRFSSFVPFAVLVIVGLSPSCQDAVATEKVVDAGAESGAVKGAVLETIDAASYTYLRLELDDGEMWAAVPRGAIDVGQTVTIVNPIRMDGFQSESLGRSFDRIVFGTLAQDSPAVGQMPPGHPSVSTQAADRDAIDVERAAGSDGRTVAELFEQRSDLSGKHVVLRGKVVKSTNAILGMNWIHLQDGTGEAAESTHDITITTQDTAEVGEVVIVRGIVQLDKDFGAGYRYPIIVEEATVER